MNPGWQYWSMYISWFLSATLIHGNPVTYGKLKMKDRCRKQVKPSHCLKYGQHQSQSFKKKTHLLDIKYEILSLTNKTNYMYWVSFTHVHINITSMSVFTHTKYQENTKHQGVNKKRRYISLSKENLKKT